ncbi:hypothetical protein ACEWY4_007437 [Coilia grayii]|uniref:NEDD4-binding protein 2 n=1 Tax=Coilia grayii TaxID=363190 RepID=A0ABD1KG92_9TELE
MPKKRKNGQSIARAPGQLNDSCSNIDSRVYGVSVPCQDEPNRSNSEYNMPSALTFSDREHIMKNMEEVFSHLDPEVIHMVLTECDFNMENAMDSLLELSNAAKGPHSLPTPDSGFEIAAALLTSDIPQPLTTAADDSSPAVHYCQSESPSLSASVPVSSPVKVQSPARQVLLGNSSVGSDSSPKQKQVSRGNSPVAELSFAGGSASIKQNDRLDFSHLLGAQVGLGGSGSAFQAYRREEQPHAVRVPWNIAAPVFQPRSVEPSFITPVVLKPTHVAQWPAYRSVSQAPLKPTATIPTSWAVQNPAIYNNKPTTSTSNYGLHFEGKVLVLLRGAPGSGKSTLARRMLDHNPGSVSLSTDEYFCRHGDYCYDPSELSTAHEWNQRRAKQAMERGESPVIIDNTNMQSWEMKPYVAMALKCKYKVVFREPDTWWKYKPRELEKHTKHGVTREKIRRMLDSYDRHVSVNSVMGSTHPSLHTEPPVTSELPQPDLLGPAPVVSLPDVSSVPVPSVFGGQPPELLDCVDLYQDPQEVNRRLSLETPLALSQSIAQREKREKDTGRHLADTLAYRAAEQSTAASQDRAAEGSKSMSSNTEGFATGTEEVSKGDGAQRAPLAFVGDWPCECQEPQGQRTTNRRRARMEGRSQGSGVSTKGKLAEGGPDFSEFQKLLNLLQGESEVKSQKELSDSEEENSLSSGPNTQPPSPSCLTKYNTHVLMSNTEIDLEEGVKREEARGKNSEEESDKEEDMKTEAEGKGIKESKDGSEKESEKNSLMAQDDGEGSSSCHVSGKRRLNQRTAKPCRLALTFTNRAPSSVSAQHIQPESLLQPENQTQDLSVESHPSCSISTQTEPHDLALLWRLEHMGLWGGAGEKILLGNASHFVPAVSDTVSVCPGPRVTHERGAQVEEEELMEARIKNEGLSILIHHFKGVAVETLKDLYEKCQQDLEWTTNLLLDSGENMSRDEEDTDRTEHEDELGALMKEVKGDEAHRKEETEREEMKDGKREKDETVGIRAAESITNTQPDDGSSGMSDKAFEGTHEGSEEADDHLQLKLSESQPHQLAESDSQIKKSSQESTSQGAMAIQSQEAFKQEVTSESNSYFIEHTNIGTSLLLDTYSELFEWTAGFQTDKHVERDGEEDMKETPEDADSVTQAIQIHLEELLKRKEEEKAREREEREMEGREEITKGSMPLDIKTLELKLPTELALQLTELFGPVGINPGEFSDDCSVTMDMNFAKLLHQKWKETIQEKQRQAALSYHLLQESSVHWGEVQTGISRPHDRNKPHFLIGADGYASLGGQSCNTEDNPSLDYRSLGQPYVSLRDIMSEEQALQDMEKNRLSLWDPELKDGAAMLKEKRLFSLFPTIDRLFLKDIFRDHNYSLEQTQTFLHCVLDMGPVKTVVATDSVPHHSHSHTPRTPSKERVQTKEQLFQDTEDPEYQDFRAEANLQRFKQQECFGKAAEAYRRGKRQVASFYAQQGHLHGQKMRDANHRAALCIFERVNASLLPENVLDLHGLHVNEALENLQRILKEKTTEYKQGLCKAQLSVITGRGNHSQGGQARIRPAVIEYLRSKHYE